MGYPFKVDGARYAGVFAIYGDETRTLRLNQGLNGSPVKIRYSPADPNISCLVSDGDSRFEQLAVTQNPDWVNQAPAFDLQDAIRGTVERPNAKDSHGYEYNKNVAHEKALLGDSSNMRYEATSKPRFNLVFLLVFLLVPYIIFVQYFVFRQPHQDLPHWFPVVAATYFFGTLTLVTLMHKKRCRSHLQ
jgi:hypothetical protein